MHKNDEYCVWNSLKTLASLVGSAFHDPCTCRSVRLMVLYDITTGWLTWVNQSLADGTDPRSGRNLLNKARHARLKGTAHDDLSVINNATNDVELITEGTTKFLQV